MPAKLPLDPGAARAIEARVAAVETRTGVQIVCAVHARSDTYPEVPWHAFALGVVVTAFITTLADLRWPDWGTPATLLLHSTLVLAVGALCAIATLFSATVARLFVGRARRAAEVRERARSVFVDHALHSTHARTGVLLYVSLFERALEVVADRGFDGRVSAEAWNAIARAMQPALAEGDCQRALINGLDVLEDRLQAAGFRNDGSRRNELADAPLQERGAA